jgi:hypothetical protein
MYDNFKGVTRQTILSNFANAKKPTKFYRAANNAVKAIIADINSGQPPVFQQSDVLIILSAYKAHKFNEQHSTHEGLLSIVQNQFKMDNIPFPASA